MGFHILNLIIRGLLVGIFLALPTGPASFIIIRKTLVRGYRVGLFAALGTITTDLFYSSVVAFGIIFIEHFLLHYNDLIRFTCGLGLMVIAWTTWCGKFHERTSHSLGMVGGYLETFWISVSNPISIVSTTALFSAIGSTELLHARADKLFFIGAIVIGGLVWWSIFLKCISWMHARHQHISLESINKVFAVVIGISGAAIFGYTMFQIGRVVWEYVQFFREFFGGLLSWWAISFFK